MLSTFLGVEAGVFVLLVTRIGGLVAVAPALGDTAIPANVRAVLAFLLAIILYPMAAPFYAMGEVSMAAFVALIIQEVLIGLCLGILGRIALSALHTAGTIIAFQSGLAAAQSFDPSQGAQGALVARMLTVIGVTMIFATGLHHLFIHACAMSFKVFPPAQPIMLGDAAALVIQQVSASFGLALQLAAPFLAYGILFNIALGIIARLMPQLQIFFIALPANITVGFVLFLFTISTIMMWFLERFESTMQALLRVG